MVATGDLDLRSLGTALGVVLILAIITFGNRLYTMSTDAKQLGELARAVAMVMSSEGRSHLDWERLAETGGSFASGPEHTAYAKELEGSRVYVSGYGLPIDQGRYKVASMLPGILNNLLVGAKNTLPYRFQSRYMLMPLTPECYLGGNPPVNQTIFVHMADGEMLDIERRVPLYLSGILQLREGPNEFYFVLLDAQKEKVLGE